MNAGAEVQTWDLFQGGEITTRADRHTIRPPGVLVRIIVPLILLVIWEIGSTGNWWSNFVLPSPLTIVNEAGHLIADGQLPAALLISLRRVAIGATIGVSLGTLLGVVAGLWQLGEELLDATLQMMRTLPYLVLIPVFILWFGVGETPKLVIIAIGAGMPMYLNTFAGVRSADPRLPEMGAMFGLGRRQLITQILLPSALPHMLTGLRYSLGYAWLSLVVAEQINAASGLGYLIYNAQNQFLTSELLVVVAVYALLGLLSDATVRLLELRLMSWRGRVVQW